MQRRFPLQLESRAELLALERSTALIGDAPLALSSPSMALFVATGSQRSTMVFSLRDVLQAKLLIVHRLVLHRWHDWTCQSQPALDTSPAEGLIHRRTSGAQQW